MFDLLHVAVFDVFLSAEVHLNRWVLLSAGALECALATTGKN